MVAAATIAKNPFAVKRVTPKAKDKDKAVPLHFADKALLERFVSAHADKNDADARLAEIGTTIKGQAEPLRLILCQKTKCIVKSLLLSDMVLTTTKDQWTKIGIERAEDLAGAFNGHFPAYFEQWEEFACDMDRLMSLSDDEEAVRAFQVLEARGVFTKKEGLDPTEQLYRDYTMDDDVRKLCQARGIVPIQSIGLPKSVSAK